MGISKHRSINISLLQARDALSSYFRPVLNEAGITDQQWRIIRLLAENGTLDFQDLADQACILRPSLTGILTRLEKARLLVRMKPSNDQRRVFLKLTDEGADMYEKTCSAIDACYDDIESKMTREKMDKLLELLHELSTLKQRESEAEEKAGQNHTEAAVSGRIPACRVFTSGRLKHPQDTVIRQNLCRTPSDSPSATPWPPAPPAYTSSPPTARPDATASP